MKCFREMLDLHWLCLCCKYTSQFAQVSLRTSSVHTSETSPATAAGTLALDVIPLDQFSILLLLQFFPLRLHWSYSLSCSFSFLLSFCRVDCTCSSYLTTTQPVECACSSWSSLSASQFHGFMVSFTHVSVIFLRMFFSPHLKTTLQMSVFCRGPFGS